MGIEPWESTADPEKNEYSNVSIVMPMTVLFICLIGKEEVSSFLKILILLIPDLKRQRSFPTELSFEGHQVIIVEIKINDIEWADNLVIMRVYALWCVFNHCHGYLFSELNCKLKNSEIFWNDYGAIIHSHLKAPEFKQIGNTENLPNLFHCSEIKAFRAWV